MGSAVAALGGHLPYRRRGRVVCFICSSWGFWPWRHTSSNRGAGTEGGRPKRDGMEATGGFEPPIRVLQTPALTTWLRRHPLSLSLSKAWCRGGDLNPYALTGTAPSRRRVYLFHHLGSTEYLSDPAGS